MKEVNYTLLAAFFVALSFIASTCGQSSRASFGEKCERGTRCDSRASLTCTNNTCLCVKPDEMAFDFQKEKCVVLSGERCSYTAIEILMDLAKEKRWTEKLECVDNAVCKEDGYCGCKAEYYEDSKGFCEAKKNYGGTCERDVECRTDKHLTCLKGKCLCNEQESVFDSTHGQCVAKAGISCSKYGLCVRNAYCQRHRLCCAGSRERDMCQCTKDFKTSKDGLCLGSYGVQCDPETSPCSDDLTCVNGKCACHYPQHQNYNRSLGLCQSIVRGPCSVARSGITFHYPCGENAECKEENGLYECLCREGYIESDQRNCRLKYGSDCKSNDVCDKVADLICANGKCSCRDLQFYDEETGMCRGLMGAVCNMTRKDFCGNGAMCDEYRDKNMGVGICRCKLDYKVDFLRNCISIGEEPIQNTIEDEEDGLMNFTTTEDSMFVELQTGE